MPCNHNSMFYLLDKPYQTYSYVFYLLDKPHQTYSNVFLSVGQTISNLQ